MLVIVKIYGKEVFSINYAMVYFANPFDGKRRTFALYIYLLQLFLSYIEPVKQGMTNHCISLSSPLSYLTTNPNHNTDLMLTL